jgi:hypothetical protein
MVPVSSFTDNTRDCKGESVLEETDGMDPTKLFHPSANLSSDELLNRPGGIAPARLLFVTSNTLSDGL